MMPRFRLDTRTDVYEIGQTIFARLRLPSGTLDERWRQKYNALASERGLEVTARGHEAETVLVVTAEKQAPPTGPQLLRKAVEDAVVLLREVKTEQSTAPSDEVQPYRTEIDNWLIGVVKANPGFKPRDDDWPFS